MSMTPGQRGEQIYQARLERRNLRYQREQAGGDLSGGPGCGGCGGLLLVIVLIAGAIAVYQVWHHLHAPPSGQVKEQPITLTSGSDYLFASSGELTPASGGAGYFLQVNGSGLSFPADVYTQPLLPASVPGYTDPCEDLYLSIDGASASIPWTKLKAGTRLCAEPQVPRGADVYDYLITVNGLTSGHQLQVDITTWDQALSRPST